jgi:hypothetical protein
VRIPPKIRFKDKSNEQKNVSTIEKKRRNKHGFMDRMASAMEEKFLVEKEDIN